MEKKRILCLDLDGTVRRSKSGKTFIEGPDDIELIPGVRERIIKYRKEDWTAVGISNQAGVAHGFKSYQQVNDEMDRTIDLLHEGIVDEFIVIQAILWCPYDAKGKVDEFNWRSLCRKPNYGMLVRVETKLVESGLSYPDWDNSLFVGDRPEDEECAKAAGIPFMYIDEFLKQSL